MNTTTALLWIAPPVLLVISLLASAHTLLNKRDSRGAFGWIAVCMSLPLGGPILYLIFGINRVNATARRHYVTKLPKDAAGTVPTPTGTRYRPLSLVGENVVGKGLTSCDEVLVLENGEALYPAMLEAIGQAQHKVLLCTYLFDKDATGALFIDALCAARDRGVEVKIIIDGMGEWLSAGRIGPVLKKCGLEFTRFDLPEQAAHRLKSGKQDLAAIDRGIENLKKGLASKAAKKNKEWDDNLPGVQRA